MSDVLRHDIFDVAEIKQTVEIPVAVRPAAISIRLDVLSEFLSRGNSVCENLSDAVN